MFKTDDAVQLSASDLVGHLNCRHLTRLDLDAVAGKAKRPFFHNPLLEILIERGKRHEHDYLDRLKANGFEIASIPGAGIARAFAEQTLAAMRAGTPVIAQAALIAGRWAGRADILMRVPKPSALGDWSYEALDTKLARETKAGTVLQLSLYSELLTHTQGTQPELMHVVTPGSGLEPEAYQTSAYAAYYRYVKRRLEQSIAPATVAETYPEPVEHCEICSWRTVCESQRRADDHLCLVAGIGKLHIDELKRHGVATASALAQLPVPLSWKPDRGAKETYQRIREQARVQIEGRRANRPIYECLTPAPTLGLTQLPAPSAGDLFLDLEADPFAGEGGLEYLFGYVSIERAGEIAYTEDWALSRDEERRGFERLVDSIMTRWVCDPGMHVYHYSPYEPAALKRLMGRYASRENEIDRMLRAGLFVDLYSIVRHAVRASVESYSIKDLECFYAFERAVDLYDARKALAALQGALELEGGAGISDDVKRTVAAYNRDDCVSALKLRDWLEQIRARLIAEGATISRPTPKDAEPHAELDERQQKLAALIQRLTSDIPVDKAARTTEQHARWILAYTLDWHRRELKSTYWERYRLQGLSLEDLNDERGAISGLTYIGPAGGTLKAPIHRYSFPAQEVDLRGGESLLMALTGDKLGKVEAISIEARTLDIKKRQDTVHVHPEAVFEHDVVSCDVQAESLLRIAEYVAEHGMLTAARYDAARDVLMRAKPRLGDEPLHRPDETTVQQAIRIAPKLAGGALAIQGPPGAGKTYTAARMICALAAAGRRVGITANSHAVIRNLLDEVVRAADEQHLGIQCMQKPEEKQDDVHRIRFTTDNATILGAIGASCQVAGGTAWLWSRPEAFEALDVLFVDEAAQMSLANVLAVSQACKTLVLLGDPQQLEQPMKGSHPDGTDVSALDHLLAGKPTIDPEQGLFLDETWRLHPDICAFTSELFYEGRLHSRHSPDRHIVKSPGRVNGSGLRYLAVTHEGNQSSSPEEAAQIRSLVEEILGTRSTWIDRRGVEVPVRLEDILIIAPYNAQLFELQARLPHGARIGTVDKFQGQEAAIVVYSMTTSSRADAPRGMEFLYSLNRLNVATSRAMCVCILVGSAALFEPDCRTPQQMRMANAFCRYLELARQLRAESPGHSRMLEMP